MEFVCQPVDVLIISIAETVIMVGSISYEIAATREAETVTLY
jgi:hypothetical protein